jgi:drug/metabolite transporter (DMT)-like permease
MTLDIAAVMCGRVGPGWYCLVVSSDAHRSISDAVEGTSQADFRPSDWGQLLLSAVIFGSSYLFVALALRSFSPGAVAFGRAALGAGALALFPAARCALRRSDWGRLVVASLLGMALPGLLFAIAQERVPSALAGMLISAVPIFTAVVAAVETRKFPRNSRLAGLLIGFGGIVLLGVPNLSGRGTESLGVVLILIGVLSYSVASTIYAPLQQTYGSMRVALWLTGAGAVWLAPFGLFSLPSSTFELISFLALLVSGVIGGGLVWALYLGLLGRVGAVRASVAGYLVPVVALVLGVVVLDERVEAIQIAGVAVALLGGYILTRGRGSRRAVVDQHGAEGLPKPQVVVNLDASCATTNSF